MPTPPLLTHPRLRALAPDPPAVVSVRNLRATLHRSGHDAWNRPGKQQPCLISVEVGFLSEFDTAASTDRLGADTLHYGMLSKAVLGCVSAVEAEEKDVIGLEGEKGVVHVLKAVWMDLTALELDGRPRDAGWMRQGKAVVDLRRVRFLSVTVALPKASLLGEGVSLTASAVFDAGGSGTMEARAMALEITRLRVPTLVGVNDNERLAKQFVIVTVTLEGLVREQDFYTHIERDVVQEMEKSSFETLEALGAQLAETVLASSWCEESWQVGIRMEKPTAVPLADCPIVTVRATPEFLGRRKGAREAGATSA